jgi:hypothetical protein
VQAPPLAEPKPMKASRPLLSICIPTCNRANLLSVCLEALADQVTEADGQVELVVADNASTDSTLDVIERFARAAPGEVIRLVRRRENVGPIENVIQVAAKDARGEFVLVIGDDDLFSPGGVQGILTALQDFGDADFLYSNVAVETGGQGWPVSAAGGFPVDPGKALCRQSGNRRVERWVSLLSAENDLATHLYCHIVRREVWRTYWSNRSPGTPYTALHSTYPHTGMLLDVASQKPAVYLGRPHLTAFYATTSWSRHRRDIFLCILPELLALAIDRGLPSTEYDACRRWLELLMAAQVYDATKAGIASGVAAGWSALRSACRYPVVGRACARAVARAYVLRARQAWKHA